MKMLFPTCSEYTCRLGIKKEEMPYIKRRIKELISDKKEQKTFLEREFIDWVGKEDEEGTFGSFISEDELAPYEKIKEELLSKRGKTCPFCKEKVEKPFTHLKELHKEEIKNVLKYIDKKEYLKLKKEIIVDNL